MNRREFLVAAQAAAATASLRSTLNPTGFFADADAVPVVPNPCTPKIPDYAKDWRFPVALWLDPIDDHRKKIEDLIFYFSRNYNLPSFRPHCTLVSGKIRDLGRALYEFLQTVDGFCSEQGTVSFKRNTSKPIGTLDNYDDSWSTFLYLSLIVDREAQEVFDHAEKVFGRVEKQFTEEIKRSSFWLTAKRDPRLNDHCASLMPHISLAYAKDSQVGIDRDKVTTTNLPETLAFSSIKVVMPAGDQQNPGVWENIVNQTTSTDLKRWNVIYSRLLLGPKLPVGSRKTILHTVIAGGQEGVDQLSLRAAQKTGLTIGGYCPPCRETDRDKNRPPVPRDLPLGETPERDSTNSVGIGQGAPGFAPFGYVARSQRTEWNCRESEGVLIVRPTSLNDPGTIWTIRFAKDYKKPVFFVDPFATDSSQEIKCVIKFLNDHSIRILNVAGPAKLDRSEVVEQFFERLFKEATASTNSA